MLDQLAPKGRLGFAVSGGGDSMALLAMGHVWAQRTGHDIAAVTVDHGLRPESATEAQIVAAYCASLGISHQILKTRPLGAQGNLQAEARNARYGLMSEWAQDNGVGAISLGHTMDDQAETVLLRLARGSGVDGLAAMAPVRHWLGIDWLRPMLDLRRACLRDWLTARGIAWADDPTNDDDHYDRVKARQALSSLAPLGIDAEGLTETATRLRAQRDALDTVTEKHLARTVAWGEFGQATLDIAAFEAIDPEIARRALSRLLKHISARDYPPRHRALAQLMQDLHSPNFKGATLGGCIVQSNGTHRLICREPASVQTQRAPWTGKATWDRRWTITGPAGADLQIGALGAPGLAHLKAAEANGWQPPQAWHSTPKSVRLTLPAIWQLQSADQSKLVAVPPIHYVNPEIDGIDGDWSGTLIMRHDALFR